MQLIRESKYSRVIAGVVLFTAAIFMSVGVALATPQVAHGQTNADLQAQINSLLATIAALQAQLSGSSSGSGSCSYTFSTNYSIGDSGAGVMDVQTFLNMDSATQVAASGVGSSGNETNFYGSLSAAAATKFQEKYASQVLAPVGLTSGTGFWGPSSRAHAQSLCDAMTGGGSSGGGVVVPTGSGLVVSSGSQPAATLAPQGAARLPFTNFTVTASSDGAVTLDSVTVEKSGLVNKAAFAGIVLLDEDGVQIGTSKTLNSNFQATVGVAVTVPAGQSRTFAIAGNMAADLSGRAGEVGGLSVVAINTSASVSGSLPITGASHTMNSTLSIGTITVAVSSFDPNTSQTKEIGTTGQRFAGIRLTAGSAEDMLLRSMRWNQTGSASASDLSNLVTVVNGIEYPTIVTSDGKFYSVLFGNGINFPKGNSIDVYVKGDIVDGSNRTIIFDIDKTTDVNIMGQEFGYGVTPPVGSGAASDDNSAFLAGTPWFDASTLTISAGSVTAINKSSSVPAQNIAVNVPNQPLGAFETDIKGESITVTTMTITVASTTGSGEGELTNVSLVDENGSVVAGPVDGVWASALVQNLSFTDTVTLPTGKHTYSLQGKVAAGIGNGGTYIVSVTPSNWGSPVGDSTGDSVTISQGVFTLNTMTVKAAALAINIASVPVAQNIVAGAQDFLFAQVQLDATQSGEDVRFSSIPLAMTFGTMEVTQVTACQLFDGGVALNTGSNVVDPTGASDADQTFTLDESLTTSKGTVKTLDLKCDLSSATSGSDTVSWGINAAPSITVTGVTSSNAVTETITAAAGQTMTVAAGSLVASEDSTSPSYSIVAAGTTGVVDGVINFRAANEDVTVQRIGLSLTNTASSSAIDLVKVSLWDGGTLVGEAVFTGSNTRATSTLSTQFVVAKDTDKDITIKVDLSDIGTSKPGTQGALIAVDIDTNSTNTQGVGSSGTTINATGSTSMNGLRVFRSFPTVAKISVPSTTQIAGVMDLYRFSIAASAGGNGIGLHQLTLNLSTSTGSAVSGTTTITLVDVRAYTDSAFSNEVPGFTNGKVITQLASIASSGDNDLQLSSILQIPAGSTYYFKVTGTVTETAGTGTFSGSITSRIGGDSTYPTLAATMGTHSTVDGNANGDNLVWSPNATTTSLSTHVDWTNGFNVSGLPSDGTDAVTISR